MSVAQQHHFIYIENNNKQWFTVNVNGKVYESIGKNFITIPKLNAEIYPLLISTQAVKETKFTISIDSTNKGFSLKQNAENELVLFDINSFVTIESDAKANAAIEQKQKENEAKKMVDSIVNYNKTVATIAENQQPKNIITKSKIKNIYTKKNVDGVDQIYVDVNAENIDTISIFIPIIKEVQLAAVKDTTKQNSNSTNVVKATNNNCKETASETDVANFAATIHAIVSLKNKIKIATDLLKEKCYSVNQIKRLDKLFVTDNYKFSFFKLAQKSVVDMKNFSSLENELSDAALIEEFKAFVNQL